MSNKRAMIRRAIAYEDKQKTAAPVNKVEKARQEGMVYGYKNGMDYATMATMRLCTTAFVAAAKEEYDLGGKRIRKLLDQYMETLRGFINSPDHETYLREWILKKYNLNLDDITGVGVALDSKRKLATPGLTEEFIIETMNHQHIDTGEIGQAVLTAYDDKSVKGRAQK